MSRTLLASITLLAAAGLVACDKEASKTEAASPVSAKPAEPAKDAKTLIPEPAPTRSGRSAGAATGRLAAPSSVVAPSGTEEPTVPSAVSPDKVATAPPADPLIEESPIAGLDLAGASAGVLSKGLTLGASDGLVSAKAKVPTPATAGAGGRHKDCVKLLACTAKAVLLAPDSVTSYAVTLESVDSLEASEASEECVTDFKDVVVILRHAGHPIPAECR